MSWFFVLNRYLLVSAPPNRTNAGARPFKIAIVELLAMLETKL